MLVYFHRFHAFPGVTRGPLILITLWVFSHYLLGTYAYLHSRRKNLGLQLRNSIFAALIVFAFASSLAAARGDEWISTVSRGFLFPVLALGSFGNFLFGWFNHKSYLWQPQELWLLIVSSRERAAISSSIQNGGLAVPCGVEWRASSGLGSLPLPLPQLLGVAGVALGDDVQPTSSDRETILNWHSQGLRILPLQTWSETFLTRLPPDLVPDRWLDSLETFGLIQSGPASRLKRLGDVSISFLLLIALFPLFPLVSQRIHSTMCSGLHGRTFSRFRWSGSGRFSSLPQLFNVLRGDMSLVGPRPFTVDSMAELAERFPGAELRQWMRPGMIGWGRIAGPPPQEHDAVAWELGRDLYYLRNHSLLLDLRLLLTSLVQLMLPAAWRP